jgi:hypothetical protein
MSRAGVLACDSLTVGPIVGMMPTTVQRDCARSLVAGRTAHVYCCVAQHAHLNQPRLQGVIDYDIEAIQLEAVLVLYHHLQTGAKQWLFELMLHSCVTATAL